MSGEDNKSKHEHKHEHRQKAKFSEDTPSEAVEKREISTRVGRGLLTDKEVLYGAPTAPSGTYIGEVFDDKGDVIRFIGAKVPLYITPDILDYEFVEHIKDNTASMAEVISRGRTPSDEDKIVITAGTVKGRTTLRKYAEPSELFATDSGAKPMLVKDYYIEPNGLLKQARGVRETISKSKLGSKLSVANKSFANAIAIRLSKER